MSADDRCADRDQEALDSVASYLDDSPVAESAIHRVWRGVDERMGSELPMKRRVPMSLWAGLAASAVIVLAIQFGGSPGPIELAGGGALVATEARTESRSLALDDGSRVHVSSGARVVPTRNDRHGVSMLVEGGTVRFEVEPGGPREWNVRTALFDVRVVGTVFVVEDAVTTGAVRVERGVVEVTELSTGEVNLLHAGDELRFDAGGMNRDAGGAPSAGATQDRTATSPLLSPSDSEVDSLTGPQRDLPNASSGDPQEEDVQAPSAEREAAPSPDWRELARSGELVAAYAALGETVPGPVADLLLAVDVARRTNHEDRAVAMLETILREHVNSDEAALAAITLGRIERRRNHFDAAIDAFDRARAIGVPASFADEVCAERALARQQAGDRAGARQVAGECMGLNGSSVYASRLRPLLRGE